IELVALGGLTYHDGQKLSFWRQFFIVLNGPLFGLILFAIASLLLQVPLIAQGPAASVLSLVRAVNLFWTVVNLLPVMPLDGGQLMRIIMEGIFGLKGFKYALVTSMAVAVLISLFFFLYQAFIIGALFFLLAFQSYDTFRRTRNLSEPDRDESLKDLLDVAEGALQQGKKKEAQEMFQKIRQTAKRGMIYNLATQYLAFLDYESGDSKAAYQLLLSIRKELASDALCLLHKAAFEQKDFPLVAELGGNCFQTWPTAETALRNAYAHAELSQSVPAVGWLETAIEEGIENIDEVLAEKSFDPIRHEEAFQQLLRAQKKESD
ncbi:MAG: site-2 protease family protein, partial [Verrucomicrobia bacterium]|nr:site-2 protease family protein [Verrucomicrobiota bacterium]